MKLLNRDGPPLRQPAGPRRDAGEIREALRREDVVLDLRRSADFAQGFIRGTINIPLNRGFAGYAGWLVPYDRDVYFVSDADDDAAVREAQAELAMIGVDRISGWFGRDVFATWTASGGELSTVARLTPDEMARNVERGAMEVVDVRAESEWRDGHIGGARLAPLGRLVELARDIPRTTPIALVCQSGSRSAIGASVLAARGYTAVGNLNGGIVEWQRAGLPLERDVPMLTTS